MKGFHLTHHMPDARYLMRRATSKVTLTASPSSIGPRGDTAEERDDGDTTSLDMFLV